MPAAAGTCDTLRNGGCTSGISWLLLWVSIRRRTSPGRIDTPGIFFRGGNGGRTKAPLIQALRQQETNAVFSNFVPAERGRSGIVARSAKNVREPGACLLGGTDFRPFEANHGVELNAIRRDTVLTVNAVEKNYASDTDSDHLAHVNEATRGQRPDELEKSRSRRHGLLNYLGTLKTAGGWELDDQRFPRRVPNHRVEVRICSECVANEEPIHREHRLLHG